MISNFRDTPLSNFYTCPVEYEGVVYPSSEHAYVAAKTTDPKVREHISKIMTAGKAKRFGRSMILRDDWDEIKVAEMHKILISKFTNPVLGEYLVSTYPHELVEGNTWGDVFWGQSPVGNGANVLGTLLMQLRYVMMCEQGLL